MGRSKPRTNKRPPPRPSRQGQSAPQPPPLQPQSTNLPYLNPSQPLDLSSFIPPPASIDPNDPAFSAALRHWSASALANPNGNGNSALPIDLPASLAALFEAKLTLDREKQKLMRMQKELKGYREGVTAVTGHAVVTGTGKGKEVAVQDDDGECTCGRNGHSHSYPTSANSADGVDEDEYYESDYECYNCDCSCHDVDCDHEEGCECDHDLDEDETEDGHHHHHHHDGYGEDEHEHTCGHHHHHHHDHQHDAQEGEADVEAEQPIAVPNPYLTHPQQPPPSQPQPQLPLDVSKMTYAEAFEAYQDQRDSAARGLDEITGMFKAAGWPGYGTAQGNGTPIPPQQSIPQEAGVPRKRLLDDPERLDEAVRELFNWIKAVVWTIEQAAVVAGRRNWMAQETR